MSKNWWVEVMAEGRRRRSEAVSFGPTNLENMAKNWWVEVMAEGRRRRSEAVSFGPTNLENMAKNWWVEVMAEGRRRRSEAVSFGPTNLDNKIEKCMCIVYVTMDFVAQCTDGTLTDFVVADHTNLVLNDGWVAACRHGRMAVVQRLLDVGHPCFNVNVGLYAAIHGDQAEVATYLYARDEPKFSEQLVIFISIALCNNDRIMTRILPDLPSAGHMMCDIMGPDTFELLYVILMCKRYKLMEMLLRMFNMTIDTFTIWALGRETRDVIDALRVYMPTLACVMLHHATLRDMPELVDYLLQDKACLEPSLAYAAGMNNMPLVHRLEACGASNYGAAVVSAVYCGNLEVFEYMFNKSQRLPAFASAGLPVACKFGRVDMVQHLIHIGGTHLWNDCVLLACAPTDDHEAIVTLLLEAAPVGYKFTRNKIIAKACQTGAHAILLKLLWLWRRKTTHWNKHMLYACKVGDVQTISIICIMAPDGYQFNWAKIMERICRYDCPDALTALITLTPVLDWNAGLLVASSNGNIEMCDKLIELGATNIEAALQKATSNQHDDLARTLAVKLSTAPACILAESA
jgi:hypothetical protein